MPEAEKTRSPFLSALLLRCPACGKGKIYQKLLKPKQECVSCGFPIGGNDAADGPAFFSITFIGILTALVASLVEIKYAPALYVHLLLWPPFVLVGTVVSLIWFKSLFIAAQYYFKVGAYENREESDAQGKKEKQQKDRR
jgi:uncharacterized protein (DUF983 family)